MVTTYEGVVEEGRIRLTEDVSLPDKTRVYVVVPHSREKSVFRVMSPRLVERERMADFKKHVRDAK